MTLLTEDAIGQVLPWISLVDLNRWTISSIIDLKVIKRYRISLD